LGKQRLAFLALAPNLLNQLGIAHQIRLNRVDIIFHALPAPADAGIAAVKKDISTMEAALKKLSQQEEKYTAELNDALQQYADLKTQSAEFDPDELQDARLDLRPAMERSVVDRVQSAYGDKYDYLMMYDSKRDVV